MHSISSSAIILDTLVKSTLLLAIASAAALVLKKRSAATQHMVRTFALAALLLLPISVMLVPTWHIKGLPQYPKSRPSMPQTARRQAAISPTPVMQRQAQASLVTHTAVSVATAPANTRVKRQDRTAKPLNTQPVESGSASAIAPTNSPLSAESVPVEQIASETSPTNLIPTFLPKLLLGLWIAGALFFLARWRLNAMRLAALVRRASVLTDSGWNAQVRAVSADLGIDRHVALLVSDEIEVPITTGIMFPRIVLSPDYPEWSATRRSAILNHELAHIKRLDAFTQALANLAASLYWFHPLVWLMVRA
ncbi:MAG TPA: M56 family metallopeptidase, partial [Candidatus Angelobacter sp.]